MSNEEKKYFEFKGKPFIRRGDVLFYGDPKEKYLVKFIIKNHGKAGEKDVADAVTVQLITNTFGEKDRVIKQAERDGLYRAFDVGEYWLTEALETMKAEGR